MIRIKLTASIEKKSFHEMEGNKRVHVSCG
jgi:hypothetical protein